MIALRGFAAADAPALRAVFASAIHEVAIRDYTREQVDAWAPHSYVAAAGAGRMAALDPVVAELECGCAETAATACCGGVRSR
jgi:putative acetyltransferase